MGHKIRPDSMRIGIIENWRSRGLSLKNMPERLVEDELIRKIIRKQILQAGVDSIEIERTNNVCRILIKAQKPGIIIGRGGKGIEDLHLLVNKAIFKLRREKYKNKKMEPLAINLNVEEVKKNDVSASIVAQNMATDLEKRLPTRQVMRRSLDMIMQYKEVRGAKILLSGRLDGAEIARNNRLMKGALPLQNLRAKIDYGTATAFTVYGTVGIKIWIYKGEVFDDNLKLKNKG